MRQLDLGRGLTRVTSAAMDLALVSRAVPNEHALVAAISADGAR
ncbi:MAG TPA: hypothetical protein VMJ10_18775 [Kofleriaceae bacterium]|nr:hypothetical protein [Kofleriaceae bacterium]